jgi:hypothetical protein
MLIGGIFGWGFEPSVDPDAGHAHHDDGGHGAPDEPALATAGTEEHA